MRATVSEIIGSVRTKGDEGVLGFIKKFDGVELFPEQMRVSQDDLAAAWDATEAGLREALVASHANIFAFAEKSLRRDWTWRNHQGADVGEVFHPFERVGCYVPGGTAPLISTALMTVTLAKAAEVPEIVVCTPCGKDGKVNAGLLAALHLAGATEVYKIGGAQAIAAMAYGTQTIRPVVKIFGPGNSYVVEAKRQCFGVVSIDLLPGPSEVLILADESANPAFVAADLLAQAEHGKDSKAGLITPDEGLLDAVAAEVDRQVSSLGRQAQLQPVLEKDVFLLQVHSMEEGAKLVNDYAPEHLILVAKNEEAILPLVRTAGAIFLGNYSPVPAGDFLAGPSHTLPTGGSGKSFQGLTADMFQRRTSLIRMDKASCDKSEPLVRSLALAEGLDAHHHALKIRGKHGDC